MDKHNRKQHKNRKQHQNRRRDQQPTQNKNLNEKLIANVAYASEKVRRIQEDIEQIKQSLEYDRSRIEKLKREDKKFQVFIYTVVFHVKIFLKKSSDDNISALSGQSAFFVALSIIPLVMFLISLDVILTGSSNEITAVETSGAFNSAQTVIMNFIVSSFRSISSGTAIITAVMALWSSGKGLYIITGGIQRIYHLPKKHSWLLRRVFAMAYTAILLLMLLLIAVVIFLNFIFEVFVNEQTNHLPLITEILYGWRYIIVTVMITIFLTLALKMYLLRKLPDKRYVKFRVLLPGMFLTAVSWAVLTWGFGIYSKLFTSSVYGSLGSVFILMMWIYFMMMLLLYGVQINCIYRDVFYQFTPKKIIGKLKKCFFKKKSKKKAASK